MWSLAATNFAGTGLSGGGGSGEHTHSVATEFINDADGDLNMKNHKITNMSSPTDNDDAVNKQYVDTTKHNLTSNLMLNSNQLWLSNDNTVRLQALRNGEINNLMIAAPNGLFVLAGTQVIFTATPSHILVHNKRITSVANPQQETDAANKQYVDAQTFSGDMKNKKITNLAKPTEKNDATNKEYVDYMTLTRTKSEDLNMNHFRISNLRISEVATDAARVDQLFKGNMNSKKIINLAEPTDNQDAATKNYVDPVVVDKTIPGQTTSQTVSFKKNSWTTITISILFFDEVATQTLSRVAALNRVTTFSKRGDGLIGNTNYKYTYNGSFRLKEAKDDSITFDFFHVGYIQDGSTTFVNRNNQNNYAIIELIFR